jgi:hypothetical protein
MERTGCMQCRPKECLWVMARDVSDTVYHSDTLQARVYTHTQEGARVCGGRHGGAAKVLGKS